VNPEAPDRDSIPRRFAENLLAVAWVGAIGVACLAALGFVLAFVVRLIDRQDYGGYGSPPPVHWWFLAAAVGAVILAVGIYSLVEPGAEPDYCPNCDCASCKEIRAERERDDVMAAAMAGGVAGGMIGGQAGNP
jgi:hypothetical protein